MLKYNEDESINELLQYIKDTYKQHYVGEDNIQSLDLIFSVGYGENFCLSNIIKYAARYGKKTNDPEDVKKDIMKMLHYAILLNYLFEKGVKKSKEEKNGN